MVAIFCNTLFTLNRTFAVRPHDDCTTLVPGRGRCEGKKEIEESISLRAEGKCVCVCVYF